MDISAMASVHLRWHNLFPVNPNGRSLFHRRTAAKPQKKFRIQANIETQVVPSRTQRIMEGISVSGEVGGAGGVYSYNALKRLDQIWSRICSGQEVPEPAQEVVRRVSGAFSRSDLGEKAIDTFDVLVCGGTLGVFIATALSLKGLRVGIVERNVLKGREQEWNISRKELMELVEVGVLTEDEIEQATAMKFNPMCI